MTRRVIDQDALGPLSKVGQGGQGIVYRAPDFKTAFADSMVFKKYKPAERATVDFAALSAMPALVEGGDGARLISVAAWPCAIVENGAGPSGFVMPSIPDRFFIPLATAKGVSPAVAEFQHLLNEPAVLASLGITIDDVQRYGLLREVAGTLAFLHEVDVCVGDISPKNLLFSLDPREAVYFIDCDAMRVNGVTALPQVETPGWEVPSGEDLATVYSDTYKLGLLALRLVAGDQQTTDVARIPATTPNLLRQIITDTLGNEPGCRPLPTAWTYILGHAIEEVQHRKATAPAPRPGSPPVQVRTGRKPSPATNVNAAERTRAATPEPSAPPRESLATNPWIVGGLASAGVAVAVLFAVVIITAIGTHEISQPTTRTTTTPTSSPGPSIPVAQPRATTPATAAPLSRPPLRLLYQDADSYDDTTCAGGKPVPQHRGRFAGRGSQATSCIFALNVGVAYWTYNTIPVSEVTEIVASHEGTVTCPSTGARNCNGDDYMMRCAIWYTDKWITCTGGNDARVFLF